MPFIPNWFNLGRAWVEWVAHPSSKVSDTRPRVNPPGGSAVSEKSSVSSHPALKSRWYTVAEATPAGTVKEPLNCVQLEAAPRSPIHW